MTGDIIKTDFIILWGLAFVVIGCVSEKFYWARGLYGGSSGKRAPTWAGRLMFIGVGGTFILFGFMHMFFGYGTIR